MSVWDNFRGRKVKKARIVCPVDASKSLLIHVRDIFCRSSLA